MKLQAAHLDRTAGVLVAQACGDALGVPYEFSAPPSGEPEMKGGGLGPYAPGEYSDDTQMAVCIAEVAAKGLDLTSDDALDEIAELFLEWQEKGASDVGVQTSRVLSQRPGMVQVAPQTGLETPHGGSTSRPGRTSGQRRAVRGLGPVAVRPEKRTAERPPL